ncbi:PREDICTED: uncharacterized protein LOC109242936 [Nicotiana attenuata]|uniref:uncharacterized protein LOC109242936 n=1 Tax=Nicotiana attenuata TaxID=49451 RepID=UPI0009052C04|nr:PREDICTED: uncharacterized protein LOC109242936 [Nicotiana attenuata]
MEDRVRVVLRLAAGNWSVLLCDRVRTEDCRQLKEEVAWLFNNGHLREFLSDRAKNHFRNRDSNKQDEQEEPLHVINMINGGVDIPQRPMLKHTKLSITREKWTRDYVPEGTLSFNDKDAKGIVQPHNDALNVPADRVLNGFNRACKTTKGEIVLPVNIAGTVQEAKFYVIEGDMRYNTFFGSPWIHNKKEIPSTLHKVLKFPIPGGIKIVYGEQPAAKEMFAVDEVTLTSTLSTLEDPNRLVKDGAT